MLQMNKRSSWLTALLLAPCFVWANQAMSQDDSKIDDLDLAKGIILAPKAFRLAANKVMKSVVTIESFGGVSSVQGRIGGIRRQGEGSTTGVIVSADGYVITSSFNFIQKPPIITLTTNDGRKHVAKPIASDQTRKLTLLKIENVEGLPVPEFLDPAEVKVGQWAISVGIGFGDSNPAISAGIISAKNRAFGRAVQTDANISPANYGGPLLDIRGRVIGICVPLNPKSNSLASGVEWYDSGIGFAIPLHGNSVIEKLKQGKDIKPGGMGIATKPASLDGSGVKVVTVVKDSPAEKAGIKKDDMIVKLGEYVVQDATQFRTLVGRFDAGDKAEVLVKRGDQEMKLDLTFSVRSSRPPQANPGGANPKKGNQPSKKKEPNKKEPGEEEKKAEKSNSDSAKAAGKNDDPKKATSK